MQYRGMHLRGVSPRVLPLVLQSQSVLRLQRTRSGARSVATWQWSHGFATRDVYLAIISEFGERDAARLTSTSSESETSMLTALELLMVARVGARPWNLVHVSVQFRRAHMLLIPDEIEVCIMLPLSHAMYI